MMGAVYDPLLDSGIAHAVITLQEAGVETFESCAGDDGHAYPEPTIRFHGGSHEGYRALAVALAARLGVVSLRRIWIIIDGEPTGPWWEMTFRKEGMPHEGSACRVDCERRERSASLNTIVNQSHSASQD